MTTFDGIGDFQTAKKVIFIGRSVLRKQRVSRMQSADKIYFRQGKVRISRLLQMQILYKEIDIYSLIRLEKIPLGFFDMLNPSIVFEGSFIVF